MKLKFRKEKSRMLLDLTRSTLRTKFPERFREKLSRICVDAIQYIRVENSVNSISNFPSKNSPRSQVDSKRLKVLKVPGSFTEFDWGEGLIFPGISSRSFEKQNFQRIFLIGNLKFPSNVEISIS